MTGMALGTGGWLFYWLIGIPGGADNRKILLLVAILALMGGMRDLGLLPLCLPQQSCQVPRYWLPALGPYRAAFFWGCLIGAGIRTRYRYAILYVLGLWILCAGEPLWGAVILGIYGLTHGIALACIIALHHLQVARPIVEVLPQYSVFLFTVSGICLLVMFPVMLLRALV
jgi:hypothetical protein